MKSTRIVAIILIPLSFLWNIKPSIAENNLACSKQGTKIFYLNGIRGGEKPENVQPTMDRIQNVMLQDEFYYKNIDEDKNGLVKVNLKNYFQVLHNKSYGFMDDLIESNYQQALAKRGPNQQAQLDMVFARAMFFHPQESELSNLDFPQSSLPDQALAVKLQNEIDVKAKIMANHLVTTTLLTEQVGLAMEEGKKVIVVAHSQGNLFEAEIRNKLFNTQDAKFKDRQYIDRYYGSLNVASAGESIGKNAEEIKHTQDILSRTGIGTAANYKIVVSDSPNCYYSYAPFVPSLPTDWPALRNFVCLSDIFLLHKMDNVYLNPGIVVKSLKDPKEKAVSLLNLFKTKMAKVAAKLAPNCCEDNAGAITSEKLHIHYNKQYKVSSGNLIETAASAGGLVTDHEEAVVSPYAYIDERSVVCGKSNIGAYTYIGSKLNIDDYQYGSTILNSTLGSAFGALSVSEIYNYFKTLGHYKYDGSTNFSNLGLFVAGINLKNSTIEGFVDIGTHFSNRFKKRPLFENVNLRSTNVIEKSHPKDDFDNCKIKIVGVSEAKNLNIEGRAIIWSRISTASKPEFEGYEGTKIYNVTLKVKGQYIDGTAKPNNFIILSIDNLVENVTISNLDERYFSEVVGEEIKNINIEGGGAYFFKSLTSTPYKSSVKDSNIRFDLGHSTHRGWSSLTFKNYPNNSVVLDKSYVDGTGPDLIMENSKLSSFNYTHRCIDLIGTSLTIFNSDLSNGSSWCNNFTNVSSNYIHFGSQDISNKNCSPVPNPDVSPNPPAPNQSLVMLGDWRDYRVCRPY